MTPDPIPLALSSDWIDPAFDQEFDALVQQLGARNKQLVAGSVEIVGLDDVRGSLGERWHAVANHAHDIAASEIRRYLSDQDVFRAQGETRFVICFASLDRAQASRKAVLIASAIRARLINELPEVKEQTSVERFVTEVDPRDIAGEASLADRLAATLDRIQGEVEVVAAAHRRGALKDFQLRFAPEWNVRTHNTDYNRCVASSLSFDRSLANLRKLGDGLHVDKALAELDYMTIARSVERLHSAAISGVHTRLLMPISFNSLFMPEPSRDYLKLLASIPGAYRDQIVLEVRNLDKSVTLPDILSLRDRLGTSISRLVVELDDESPLLPMFEPGDIFGVSYDLRAIRCSEPSEHYRLKKFVSIARDAHLVTYAHNATTLGVAGLAVQTGFNYVDGPAVHLSTVDPRAAVRLKPMIDIGGLAPARSATRVAQ